MRRFGVQRQICGRGSVRQACADTLRARRVAVPPVKCRTSVQRGREGHTVTVPRCGVGHGRGGDAVTGGQRRAGVAVEVQAQTYVGNNRGDKKIVDMHHVADFSTLRRARDRGIGQPSFCLVCIGAELVVYRRAAELQFHVVVAAVDRCPYLHRTIGLYRLRGCIREQNGLCCGVECRITGFAAERNAQSLPKYAVSKVRL